MFGVLAFVAGAFGQLLRPRDKPVFWLSHAGHRQLQISGAAKAALGFGQNSSPASVQVLPAVLALGQQGRSCCRLAPRVALRITTRSSRTRFAAWLLRINLAIIGFGNRPVAGRLNSGVRPQEEHVRIHSNES